MEQREKLIELLEQCNKEYPGTFKNLHFELAYVADKLLANGVVVLPCRCCECEHCEIGQNDIEQWCICTLRCGYDVVVDPTDFCSYGKRKGGDE